MIPDLTHLDDAALRAALEEAARLHLEAIDQMTATRRLRDALIREGYVRAIPNLHLAAGTTKGRVAQIAGVRAVTAPPAAAQ